MSGITFNNIPNDVQQEVFTFLDNDSKVSAGCVCRDWHRKITFLFLQKLSQQVCSFSDLPLQNHVSTFLLAQTEEQTPFPQLNIETIRAAYRTLGVEFLIGNRTCIYSILKLDRDRQKEHELSFSQIQPKLLEDIGGHGIQLPKTDASLDEMRDILVQNSDSWINCELYSFELWSIPLEINLFSKLTRLILSNNEICEIPNLPLINLRGLNLSHNNISVVQNLNNFPNLRNIDLSDNKISRLTKLKNLTQLEILHLQRNKITDISALSKLSNIESLYLMENKIVDPTPLSELPNLTYVHLQCNQIKNFPHFKNAETLFRLGLYENPCVRFCDNYNKIFVGEAVAFNKNFVGEAIAFHYAQTAIGACEETLQKAKDQVDEHCLIS